LIFIFLNPWKKEMAAVLLKPYYQTLSITHQEL
jgi:hypothetical protein